MMILILFLFFFTLQSNTEGYQLDIKCHYSWQCPSSLHYCDPHLQLCLCNPSRPVNLHNMCLPALKYGDHCEYSDSCRFLDVNTFCHRTKGCVCKEGFRPYNQHLLNKCAPRDTRYYGNWPYDEDNSDEDSDEDDDDDDVTSNVAAPIIVGIVLGSLIVCGWSCAICRVYLKKMEKQRVRTHQRRMRRHKINHPTTRPIGSELEFPIDTITSIQSNEMPLLNEPNRHSCGATIIPVHQKNSQLNRSGLSGNFSCATVTAHLCPDEEPLPGYEGSFKESTECEIELLPPSYDEVMKESNRDQSIV
uniref:EB domain-containing protein n=1 Tax=Strigamia maritima TaxID=126957 RepID=T1JDP8_STRMM